MFKKYFAALLVATSAVAAPAYSAEWPERPVRIVVPFPPGGGGDLTARIVSEAMSRKLNQSFVIENRPGGGGVIGTQVVARAEPDGYTLLFPAFFSLNEAQEREGLRQSPLPYKSMEDFQAVGRIAKLQIMLLAKPELGVASLTELVQKAKADPAGLTAATPGVSSPHHLAFLMLQQMADIDLLLVPYQGSGPATVALQGGQVDLAFAAVGPANTLIDNNKAVPLGVTGPARDPLAPAVPTISESGFPEFSIESWFGLLAPSGVSPEVIASITNALQEVLADSDVQEKLAASGMTASYANPQEFWTAIEADVAMMQGLFRNAPPEQ